MIKNDFYIEFENEKLHGICWRPEGDVRAVLQIVHGMVEYIDRYDHFARFLCERGIAVVGHDHPGHGVTAGKALGYIKRNGGSDHLVSCTRRVTEYIKEEFAGKKVFILGHSMGSFVVRRYLTAYSEDVSGACIMGTASMPLAVLSAGRALASLVASVKGEDHPSKLLTEISFAGYNKRFPKEEGIHAWISSDREVVRRYDGDPFCSYTFSAGGFGTLYDTIYALEKKRDFDKIRRDLPVFVVAGEEDPVGAYGKGPATCAEVLRSLGLSRVELKLYRGMRHEILNEKGKEAPYSDILSFIEKLI